MKALSAKLKDYSCFSPGWAGFDEFKPITVIIGRNNTGKSRLLELVEILTIEDPLKAGFSMSCSGRLDEAFLQGPFSKRDSGGDLGPNYGVFYEEHSHWNETGKHYVGDRIRWTMSTSRKAGDLRIPNRSGRYQAAAEAAICEHLHKIRTPLHLKSFRRILADRDIQAEVESIDMELRSDGTGATNIVRRLINVVGFDEELIQTQLLTALDTIFGDDGEFDRIEVRHHESDNGNDDACWEVFLGEPEKGLVPLSKSGSGLKTVILVLLNLLVTPTIEEKDRRSFVFAFEELENNLHPALLRRLLQYVAEYVKREKCMLFLTTHSNVTLDFFSTRDDSQIIHVTHDGVSAKARTIKAHFDHVGLLTELGSRPSDLLQANGVVWLEGPSDRIYMNRLIEIYSSGQLREGRDYQCAFYGGALLAKSSFSDPENSDETFANLLRLNNNIAVICDGDRTAKSGKGSRIKGRVQRIRREVDEVPTAYLWISEAKEIENYIPGEVWAAVYGIEAVSDPQQFDRFPSTASSGDTFIQKRLKRKTFDKVEFALSAAPHLSRENLRTRFELDAVMPELVEVIRSWNR